MVSFRYHLVSLIAVFMALATGILVGSSLLNQSLIDSQRSTISQQQTEKDNLRRELDLARNEVAYRNSYLDAIDDRLLAGRLAGQRVLLVTMPGAAGGDADGLTDILGKAGARVTGRLGISEAFFATDARDGKPGDAGAGGNSGANSGGNSDDLDDEARDAAAKARARDEIVRKHPVPELRGQPVEVQLAGALLTKGGADRAVTPPAKTFLEQLDRGGFLSRNGLADRADLVVILLATPPDPAPSAPDAVTRGLPTLAAALDAAGNGVVVAAPTKAVTGGGAMEAIRKNNATRTTISTVDTVEAVFGRVALVLALVEQMSGGVGHYGATTDAEAPLPPEPTPGER